MGDDVKLEVKSFDTESGFDYLTVNGEKYDGSGGPYRGQGSGNIHDVQTVSGEITWYTDYSVTRSGWTVCGQTVKDDGENRGLQYYPAMYFVDKKYNGLPMTCTGTVVGSPIYFKSYHLCAAACDAALQSCVGFSYFPTGHTKPNLCFLFSSFESGTYYTGCDKKDKKDKKGSFLDKSNATKTDQPIAEEPTFPVCVAKLEKFLGTTLKPDPSGKCKQCMTKLTKADRCWE